MFESVKVNRISQNIVVQIRNAILSGNLNPGDKLPTERELSTKFNVSKASLREALRALEALGLLEVRQGVLGGAFIREVDNETAGNSLFNYIFFQNPSISEFTQLRSFIEPPAAALAAEIITDEDLEDLEKNMALSKKEINSGTFYYDLDTYFHHKIASIAGNTLICFIIDSVKKAVVNIKLNLQLKKNFSLKVYHAHEQIMEALRNKDPEAAHETMLNHIIEVDNMLKNHCDADSPFRS